MDLLYCLCRLFTCGKIALATKGISSEIVVEGRQELLKW